MNYGHCCTPVVRAVYQTGDGPPHFFYHQNNFSKENFSIAEDIDVKADTLAFLPPAAHTLRDGGPPFSLVNGNLCLRF